MKNDEKAKEADVSSSNSKIKKSSKKGGKKGNKHIDPLVLQTRRQIQLCARDNDLRQALNLYDDAVKNGIEIESQTFHCLLSMCSMIDHRGGLTGSGEDRSVGMPSIATKQIKKQIKLRDGEDVDHEVLNDNQKEGKTILKQGKIPLSERKKHAYRLKERMNELSLKLNESGYTVLIRLFCESYNADYEQSKIHENSNSNLKLAVNLLDEAEKLVDIRIKLRVYTPIIESFSLVSDLKGALSMWERAANQKIDLGEIEYSNILKCAISVGDVLVVDRILANIAEDILVPSKNTSDIILEWFKDSAKSEYDINNNKSQSTSWNLVDIPKANEASSLGPIQSRLGWDISTDCSVDTRTGKLLDGVMKGFILKPVPLTEKSWNDLMSMNELIVKNGSLDDHKSEFQGGKKGKKRTIDDIPKRM